MTKTNVPDTAPRIARRTLFKIIGATGGAAVLAGTGVGIYEWVTPSGTPSTVFRSRPDLGPAPLSVEVPADGTAPGYVFLTPAAGPGQYGPMIVDNDGQLVWFRQIVPPAPFHVATNLKVQEYMGQSVLTWWEGTVVLPQGYGKGEYVIADHSYREITRVRAQNGLQGDLHEFRLTKEGTALFTAYQAKKASLVSVGGPPEGIVLDSSIQEVDVASGKLLFQWDAMDHIALADSYASVTGLAADGGQYDFFHANSIDVDTDNNLLISSRNTWAVYKIERRTGSVIWRLNGKRSDFTMGSGSRFEFQHDAKHFGNGQLTVFDDGGSPNVALSSRGLLLSVDETTHRVELVQEYLPDPSFVTGSQGSVQMLPNGNAFVGWGAEPYATEYASDGRLLFELQLAPTGVSYRAFRFEWTGRPDDSPAIALQAASGNKTNVFVSWNGATEVRSWRMLAGRNARSLTTIRTVPRVGFETMITVPSHPAIAVSALDASGTELGRTRTVSG